MKRFRDVIFWAHLTAGLLAGVVIFIMCVTGALLAFERQTIELFERDARWVQVQPGAQQLGPLEVLSKVIEARPQAKPATLAIRNESGAAWEIGLGREGAVFANPYTGEITGESHK